MATPQLKPSCAASYLVGSPSARRCDSCRAAPALLHCRADAAFLCAACDARVHGANGLASRHERTWLCEVCELSPAVVTCKADAAALCAACDADIHSANPLARRHDRVPLLPFVGPAPKPNSSSGGNGAVVDSVCTMGGEEGDVELEEEEEAASWLMPEPPATFFFSDTDPYLDLDYGTSSMEDAKLAGIIEPNVGDVFGGKVKQEVSLCNSMCSSEVAVVPELSQTSSIGVPAVVVDAAVARMDREARVMRYREKRKNRKFEKTIRYASRKAYAEARPRIKGRFAKRSEVEAVVGRMYSSAADAVAALLVDDDYGVVPSF